ncbi:uncharacterized protein LOC143855185 isoform X2 [Tasmannia lanceolata]|uniref:uncharacterized protein LOC143855185 isoform X2 n=1 Tax=Tasmannia lanceolata TaxID=3420 RepID=UPI0040638F8B
MAANYNMGFHHGAIPAYAFNYHAITFQSGAINSSDGMIGMGDSGGMNSAPEMIFPENSGGMNSASVMIFPGNSGGMNSASEMIFPGNSGGMNSASEMIASEMIFPGNSGGMNSASEMIFPGNSSGMNSMTELSPTGSSGSGLLLDTVPGLKHDSGLAVDWSIEEQSLLEDGLVKFSDEPNIMRYIKIAATLHEKTVRDVALRCRWMTRKDNGKRRKSEEPYAGKKMKDRKEKLMDSSSKANIPTAPQPTMAPPSFIMHHTKHNDHMPCGVPAIGDATRHLLDENAQVFSQISANLEAFKIQENIDLFYHSRNNIMAILNEMRDMPGIMSQMPPLPVSINEELANGLMFGTHGGIDSGGICLKQEPRC